MKKIKLSTQLLILFTTITILSAVVFGLVTYRNYESIYLQVAFSQLETTIDNVAKKDIITDNEIEDRYLGYVVANFENDMLLPAMRISDSLKDFDIYFDDEAEIQKVVANAYSGFKSYEAESGVTYYLYLSDGKNISPTAQEYVIGIMHEEKISEIKISSAQSDVLLSFTGTFIAFAIIIVVGNIILALWSREVTKRIQYLSRQISFLSESGYKKEIVVTGSDEIRDLSVQVEKMRQEIEQNEKTKQEMFQNLSHDFKTPITVIKSYAEAIEDGIAGIEDTKIIIEQTKKLEQKVSQLLEYNKLEYFDNTKPLVEVKMKRVIQRVLADYKILLKKYEVIVELDNSLFYGFEENYITVVSNIIDNAIRYVKTKIVITLKNERLTIYNDGDPIDKKYIENLFKPYEKGTEGQFGLGMSIVQKTVNRFGYRLAVKNTNGGVVFIIEP